MLRKVIYLLAICVYGCGVKRPAIINIKPKFDTTGWVIKCTYPTNIDFHYKNQPK